MRCCPGNRRTIVYIFLNHCIHFDTILSFLLFGKFFLKINYWRDVYMSIIRLCLFLVMCSAMGLFFGATCSQFSGIKNKFNDALETFGKFIDSGEPFQLSEILSIDSIPMPQGMKDALSRVIVVERSFDISLQNQTAILKCGIEIFGQKVIAKLRMGLEYPGPTKKEKPLEIKRLESEEDEAIVTTIDIPDIFVKNNNPVLLSKLTGISSEPRDTFFTNQDAYSGKREPISDEDKKWIAETKEKYEKEGAPVLTDYLVEEGIPHRQQVLFIETLPKQEKKTFEKMLEEKQTKALSEQSSNQNFLPIKSEEDVVAQEPKKDAAEEIATNSYVPGQTLEDYLRKLRGLYEVIEEPETDKVNLDDFESFLNNRSGKELEDIKSEFEKKSGKQVVKPGIIRPSILDEREFDQSLKNKNINNLAQMIVDNKILPDMLVKKSEQKGLLITEEEIEAILQRVNALQKAKDQAFKIQEMKNRTPEKIFERVLQKKTLEAQLEKAKTRIQESVKILTNTKTTAKNLKNNAIEKLKSVTPKFSLLIGIPKVFSFAAIDSRLKALDTIQFQKAALALSQSDYFDSDFDIKIGRGLNILGTVKIAGPLENITNIIGQDLTSVTIHGIIDPAIFGSRFSAILPGSLNFGKNIKTGGLKLNIYLKEVGITIGIETGLKIKPPKQEEWLDFVGEITVAAEKASFEFNMRGMWENIFGIPGPKMGNVKFKATIDYTFAAATEGILSLSGLGFGGEIGIGGKSVEANVYGEVSTTEDILVSGEIKGGIFLEDIVSFSLEIVEAYAKLAQQIGGLADKKIDISRITQFKNIVEKNVPHLGFETAYFSMSPKVMFFGGKKYDGIEFNLTTHLLDKKLTMRLKLDKTGIEGFGSMSEIKIGPVVISGVGKDKTQGTIDDGPAVSLMLKPSEGKAALFLSGSIDAYLFGKHFFVDTLLDVSPAGLHAKFVQDIGIFKMQLELSALLKEPKDFFIKAHMEQEALDKLSVLLEKGSKEIIERSNRDISRAQQEVSAAYKKVTAAKEEITKIKERRQKIEAENKTTIARARAKIEQDITKYEQAQTELNKAIEQCKGQAPQEALQDIDSKARIYEPSQLDRQHAIDALKAIGLNPEQIRAVQHEANKVQ
jgi:hypothetical protein